MYFCTVKNNKNQKEMELNLPSPHYELEQELKKIGYVDYRERASIKIVSFLNNENNIVNIPNECIQSDSDIIELNHICLKIDCLDEQEKEQLKNLLVIESPKTLENLSEIIKDVFSSQYEVVEHIKNLEDFARWYFRGAHDEFTYNCIDFKKAGNLLHQEYNGTLHPDKEVYIYKAFHDYSNPPDYPTFDSKTLASICYENESAKKEYLFLPAGELMMSYLAENISHKDEIVWINQNFSELFADICLCKNEDIESLNNKLKELYFAPESTLIKLKAFMQFIYRNDTTAFNKTLNKKTIVDKINYFLIHNEEYEFLPNINSLEEYGKYLVEERGIYDELDEEILQFIDYRGIGKMYSHISDGAYTDYGLFIDYVDHKEMDNENEEEMEI